MLFKRFNAVEIECLRATHCCGHFVSLVPIEEVYKRSTQTSILLLKCTVLKKVLESEKVTSLNNSIRLFYIRTVLYTIPVHFIGMPGRTQRRRMRSIIA